MIKGKKDWFWIFVVLIIFGAISGKIWLLGEKLFSLSNFANDAFFFGILFLFGGFIGYRKNKDRIILKELNESIFFLNSKEFINSTEYYNDINDEFFNKVKYSGLSKIWKSYNSSMIEIEEKGINLFSQTNDAEIFYNNDVLLKERMNTKILNYVPQLMVGLGLLGTFLGLSMGLSGLDLKDSGDISQVNNLIDGVKTSFYTSLYGMYFSICFTILINIHLGEIEKKILELKDKLNNLFHKNNGSEIVQEIKREIAQIRASNEGMASSITNGISQEMNKYRESNETSLREITEMLGSKIGGISQGLSGSFEKTMGESLDKIFSSDFIEKFENVKNQLIEVSEKNNMFISEYKNEIKEIAYTTGELKDSYVGLTTKMVDDFNEVKNNLDEKFIQFKNIFDNSMDMYKNLNEFYEKNTFILNGSNEIVGKFENVSENLNGFIEAQNSTVNLWGSYKESFENLNELVFENIKIYKEELSNSIKTYENILSKNSENYGEIIDLRTLQYTESINNSTDKVFSNINNLINGNMKNYEELIRYGTDEYQKVLSESSEIYNQIISKNSENYGEVIDKSTLEYTKNINTGIVSLFSQYEENLVAVIDKFNGTLKLFKEDLNKMGEVLNITVKLSDTNSKVSEENEKAIRQLTKLKQEQLAYEKNSITQETKGEY